MDSPMNGWQRLFALLAVIIILPAIALAAVGFPRANTRSFADGCAEYQSYTIQQAQAVLATKSYAQSEYSSTRCEDSLAKIASGNALSEERGRWWDTVQTGAFSIAAFLGVIYALGLAIGWVWRGFFPKKQAQD